MLRTLFSQPVDWEKCDCIDRSSFVGPIGFSCSSSRPSTRPCAIQMFSTPKSNSNSDSYAPYTGTAQFTHGRGGNNPSNPNTLSAYLETLIGESVEPLKLKVEAKVLQSVVDHIGPHKIRPRDSTQDIRPICARIFTFLGQHAVQVGRAEPDMDFV